MRTFLRMAYEIRNWLPVALTRMGWLSARPHRFIDFRRGCRIAFRGNGDWVTVYELFLGDTYQDLFQALRRHREGGVVLDLGGNIGCFALRVAEESPSLRVISFEPGPPNARLFEASLAANPEAARRIELRMEAVGGEEGEANWFFEEENHGASSLHTGKGVPYRVKVSSLARIIGELREPVAAIKIDIEGAEYELLERTPPEVWDKIDLIALELHQDPSGRTDPNGFLGRMQDLGYAVRADSSSSYFLTRKPPTSAS